MKPWADADDSRNGPGHHTGKPCIEKDCDKPAGTAWSPHWCFEHNVERIRRIDLFLKSRVEELEKHV